MLGQVASSPHLTLPAWGGLEWCHWEALGSVLGLDQVQQLILQGKGLAADWGGVVPPVLGGHGHRDVLGHPGVVHDPLVSGSGGTVSTGPPPFGVEVHDHAGPQEDP
jgi:hypothetical protein